MKKNIKDYNLDDLKKIMIEIGEKPYRAEQIFQWIFKENVTSFDDMTNISKELRDKLKENFALNVFKIITKQESKDGTKKSFASSICNEYFFGVGDCSNWCNYA